MIDIVNLVSSVGFPIAMSIILLWYCKEQNDTHRAESDNLAEAINNNTLTLQKLCDRLENVSRETKN